MILHDYLKKSSMTGTVQQLMTPGLAVEFIQPWYTPLSTTPATTGIAVGGIGSTYTVTPAGTTPVLNFLPGVQVRGASPESLRLNNFFFRESVVGAKSPLTVANTAQFYRRLAFYPLVDTKGKPLFAEGLDAAALAKACEKAAADTGLFDANADRLARWNIEWSSRTQAALQSGDRSAAFQRNWLIDFFDGVLGETPVRQGALSAAWGEEDSYLGQAGYDAAQMEYAALYPAASTTFKSAKTVDIRRVQFSPVIPGNERLSSLPVSTVVYELENKTAQTREVTLVQMQDNLCGYMALKDRQGVQDASFVLQPAARFPIGSAFYQKQADGRHTCGIEFSNKEYLNEADFTGAMAISASWNEGVQATASAKPMFYSEEQAMILSRALLSGRVNSSWVKNVYSGRETMAGALCVTVVLPPKAKASVQFALALDFPLVRMPGIVSCKKYTAFHPAPEGRVRAVLSEVLDQTNAIVASIPEAYGALLPTEGIAKLWPKAGKDRESFVTLATNTLSFLAEATVWDNEDRFLVRECADYPFFNSLDVYFYGSFGLLALMPRLDGQVMRRFSDAVLAVDNHERRHHEYVNHPYADLPDPKLQGPRGVRGAVIHDLGSPFDARPDAYDWHNVKEWKDLAPKFVLMVLRHFHATGDRSVLEYCREAVYASMQYLEDMVEPGQEFPLTHGTDDTFDNLSSHGISVYCGSLWIAGLRAAAQIAATLGDQGKAESWNARAAAAQAQFHEALWDEAEGYFHFFVTPLCLADLDLAQFAALRDALSDKLPLSVDATEAVRALNQWLNAGAHPGAGKKAQSRLEARAARKQWLTAQCPAAFLPSWNAKLGLDSDDVFVDSLLADTYLRLLGLEAIVDGKKAKRSLAKVYATNYKANTPLVGAANLVHRDGSPLDEYNFQAHDVWIGIQYSLVATMILHGMAKEAQDLAQSMVRNLYSEARIPFAAPEGFNGSCRLHPAALVAKFGLSEPKAKALHKDLLAAKALLADSRIAPELPREVKAFAKKFAPVCKKHGVDATALFALLHSTALKYTAGRYFRPGMVFAIPMAGLV